MVATPGQNPAYRPSARINSSAKRVFRPKQEFSSKKIVWAGGFLCFAVDSGWNGAKRRVPEIYAGRLAPAR